MAAPRAFLRQRLQEEQEGEEEGWNGGAKWKVSVSGCRPFHGASVLRLAAEGRRAGRAFRDTYQSWGASEVMALREGVASPLL